VAACSASQAVQALTDQVDQEQTPSLLERIEQAKAVEIALHNDFQLGGQKVSVLVSGVMEEREDKLCALYEEIETYRRDYVQKIEDIMKTFQTRIEVHRDKFRQAGVAKQREKQAQHGRNGERKTEEKVDEKDEKEAAVNEGKTDENEDDILFMQKPDVKPVLVHGEKPKQQIEVEHMEEDDILSWLFDGVHESSSAPVEPSSPVSSPTRTTMVVAVVDRKKKKKKKETRRKPGGNCKCG